MVEGACNHDVGPTHVSRVMPTILSVEYNARQNYGPEANYYDKFVVESDVENHDGPLV